MQKPNLPSSDMDKSFPRLVFTNPEVPTDPEDEWILDLPKRPLFSQNYAAALLGPFDDGDDQGTRLRIVKS